MLSIAKCQGVLFHMQMFHPDISVMVDWMVKNNSQFCADDILKTAGSVVEQSALGQCLQKAVGQSEEHMEQMFCCYISDLLLFVFKLSCDEHKVIRPVITSGDILYSHLTRNK